MLIVLWGKINTRKLYVWIGLLLFVRLPGGDEAQKIDIIIPPALIESVTSSNLYETMLARLPLSLGDLQEKADRFVLICNSDSGTSCIKLAKHLCTLVPTLHAPCRMHQLSIAVVSSVRLSGMQGALFSSTLLVRRRRVKRLLREQIRQHIEQNLHILFAPPEPEDTTRQLQVRSVMTFLKDVAKYDQANVFENIFINLMLSYINIIIMSYLVII